MDDDIVNWLRKKQRELEESWWPNEDPPLSQCGRAAVEIERLRAAGDALAERLRWWTDNTDAWYRDHRVLQRWEEVRRG